MHQSLCCLGIPPADRVDDLSVGFQLLLLRCSFQHVIKLPVHHIQNGIQHQLQGLGHKHAACFFRIEFVQFKFSGCGSGCFVGVFHFFVGFFQIIDILF